MRLHLKKNLGVMLDCLWVTYRPARHKNTTENFLLTLGLWVFAPKIFLWPFLVTLMRFCQGPTMARAWGTLYTFINLLLTPLGLLWYTLLPCLGCRLWAQTPEGEAHIALRNKMSELARKLDQSLTDLRRDRDSNG